MKLMLAGAIACGFMANACAQGAVGQGTLESGNVADSTAMSRWIGAYDPMSRACYNDTLAVHKSTFTWGGCKDANIKLISTSETKLVFEVDSNAKCGWAGWVIELDASADKRPISVNAYRDQKGYRAKQRMAYCGYSKR